MMSSNQRQLWGNAIKPNTYSIICSYTPATDDAMSSKQSWKWQKYHKSKSAVLISRNYLNKNMTTLTILTIDLVDEITLCNPHPFSDQQFEGMLTPLSLMEEQLFQLLLLQACECIVHYCQQLQVTKHTRDNYLRTFAHSFILCW